MLITLARKPLGASTVAQCCLTHGTGALNIDATRIGYQSEADQASAIPQGKPTSKVGALAGKEQNNNARTEFKADNTKGRWPANVLVGSESVMAGFPATGGGIFQKGGAPRSKSEHINQISGQPRTEAIMNYGDSGSAARYFKHIGETP